MPYSALAKIRILIADDHAAILEGLSAMIGRQPDMCVVAAANDGREAIDLWEAHRPDVTLLDLRMPHVDGVVVIEKIRARDAHARVIVFTTYDSDNEVANAIKAGARSFLLKDVRRDELLDAIRRVHQGETVFPSFLMARFIAGISKESLTGRELDVLRLLAGGRSNKEISTNLYIGEATVKSHLRSIFTKLNVVSRTEAVAEASRQGLVRI
jgi:two-component system NarL family response regulator